MEEKVIIETVLLILCVLGIIPVIIFFLRKHDNTVDYYKVINELNEQEEQNLDVLAIIDYSNIDQIDKVRECADYILDLK